MMRQTKQQAVPESMVNMEKKVVEYKGIAEFFHNYFAFFFKTILKLLFL